MHGKARAPSLGERHPSPRRPGLSALGPSPGTHRPPGSPTAPSLLPRLGVLRPQPQRAWGVGGLGSQAPGVVSSQVPLAPSLNAFLGAPMTSAELNLFLLGEVTQVLSPACPCLDPQQQRAAQSLPPAGLWPQGPGAFARSLQKLSSCWEPLNPCFQRHCQVGGSPQAPHSRPRRDGGAPQMCTAPPRRAALAQLPACPGPKLSCFLPRGGVNRKEMLVRGDSSEWNPAAWAVQEATALPPLSRPSRPAPGSLQGHLLQMAESAAGGQTHTCSHRVPPGSVCAPRPGGPALGLDAITVFSRFETAGSSGHVRLC